MLVLEVTKGAEIPDRTFIWEDGDGTPVNFSTNPHTFDVRVGTHGKPATRITTTGLTADSDSGAGVVTVSFASGWDTNLTPQTYPVEIWANEDASGLDRNPARLTLILHAAVSAS